MGMLSWIFGDRAPAPKAAAHPRESGSFWSTHANDGPRPKGAAADFVQSTLATILGKLPKLATADHAMDDMGGGGIALKMQAAAMNIPEVLAMWYASQTFIGYQLAAILAQHWLIDKACTVPARDAIRQGFDVVNVDGDDIDPKALKQIHKADRRMRLNWNLEQFVRMGRIFGIRIALFKVESTDPLYYEQPFNPDGITPGSYKGIVQVDPYWTSPQLDMGSSSMPDSQHFYEPTFWLISGRKYHRSHLIIFRNGDLPDMLKPQYMYGGVPLPQRIMERVYGAERTANEAPQLVQTKRTTVWLTDMAQFAALGDEGIQRMNDWVAYRDNYAVKMGDKSGDEFAQFDTSLADLDNVIMTQYQIVAAAANMPSTKLLGTVPKGFNSTGEYEEASYHEELESIQAHDLTPFIERHHLLVIRSEVPELKDVETTVEWRPLDTPTAKEQADMNLVKAQTGAALIQSGAISSENEQERLKRDPASGYAALELTPPPDPELEADLEDDDPAEDAQARA
jgi:phage-related protein (TIGR01555 family)